ncbi:hypothetical protein K2X14_08550 [Acetobacter sp. TBRC 12305]|uniref:Alpha 1,4-glycosyltransferase domain-containing protein n=1 Tax=Acetobacter garciniae TaxID=2817435 RepID=A0A939KN13_9PROT|nr:hypothetical protein [Acetobacter garciniae]MBO1325150.1 hypothetical protein [Acetobacter garciniae]MBX0344879.1 hypothetical protein [Acetobacter garciniae]
MPVSDLNSRQFGSFWYGGRLSALEQACANSFVSRGYGLTIFSYEPLEGVPEGVDVAPAADIVPQDMTRRFLFGGKPHLGHFSDLFRYRMIQKKDLIWVDLDMLMLARPPHPLAGDIVVKEEQGGVNGAILYLSEPDLIEQLIADVTTRMDRNLRWGETGPLALGKLVARNPGRIALSAPTLFYPLEHYDIFKVFLPEYRAECREKCAGASMLHLFNNILVKMGYWKDMAPPVGSALYDAIAQTDGLKFFKDIYPADVMRNVITNYRLRLNGGDLGIKGVIRQAIPSIRRTYLTYRPA